MNILGPYFYHIAYLVSCRFVNQPNQEIIAWNSQISDSWNFMFIISFDFFTFLYLSQRLIFVIFTEANHFCDVCEGDTGLRTDSLTLVMAHNIPGEVILFSFIRLYKYQKVAKSTWQVDVPRSGNRQSRSTVPRPRPLPGILMLAQNKMIGGLNKEIQNRIQVIDCLIATSGMGAKEHHF